MEDLYYKGEKILCRLPVTLVDTSVINFSDMTEVTIDIIDTNGNAIALTKTGGSVVEGAAANEIEFELSEAQTDALFAGYIKFDCTIRYPDSNFSGNVALAIFKDEQFFYLNQ